MAKSKKIKWKKIERKWQAKWEKAKIFEANVDTKKKKFFTSLVIPYVNGNLHVGHSFTFTRNDVYARFKRMQGFNTLLAAGFHATGEPILGTIERLKKHDKNQIETFKLYGATDKDIENFKKKGPEFAAKFWKKKIMETMKLIGYSVDWRRQFITAISPTFCRFIEWQYNTLRKKGYVIQGTHPVIWCPHDKSSTGDHDRLQGVGESPIEFTILKFKLDSGEILPCGTLRPETVFGVTNIWINPEVEYLKARIDDKETWLLSHQAVDKLKDQLKKVEVYGSVMGRSLVGRFATNAVTGKKIIVLPADFCDPDGATGIVMSVPAHAVWDMIALMDLKKSGKELVKYGISVDAIRNIEPISVIQTPGLGSNPAGEFIQKFGITSQKDKEKLDKATNELYKKEFHMGTLHEIAGEFAGKDVDDVKEELIKVLREKGAADIIWEMTGKVVCRCSNACHVKIVENQWFIKYSDEEWKQKAKEAIASMLFYPPIVRSAFENTVDWLKDKACTRKTGLGTKLPWDKEWIVETLSDSTIYMAFYTIARVISENDIPAEKLTDEVFDYVFTGRGDVKKVAKISGLGEKIIGEMKNEFEYFYPVDLRTSSKDLLQNHLTFYIFQHTAIWENEKYWPKAIGINGFVNVSGTKMSKSLGNIIPLKNLVNDVGADLVRANIVASNEGTDDADWRDESVASYESRLQMLFDFVSELKKLKAKAKRKTVENIDRYIASKTQQHIKQATENYEHMKFRSSTQSALFELTNDISWYVSRCGGIANCHAQTLAEVLSVCVRLISPIMPHASEELWEMLGNKTFIATEKWPEVEMSKIDKNAMDMEDILKRTIEDLRNVVKLAGKNNAAHLYVLTDKEFAHLKEAENFIAQQLGFKKVSVYRVADSDKYDPQNKSSKAKFGKPGIFVE
jgi:leucyl-tRNA synthetase